MPAWIRDLPRCHRQRLDPDAAQPRAPQILELLGRADHGEPGKPAADLLGGHGRTYGEHERAALNSSGVVSSVVVRTPLLCTRSGTGHGLALDLGQTDQQLADRRDQRQVSCPRLRMAVDREGWRPRSPAAVGRHLAGQADQELVETLRMQRALLAQMHDLRLGPVDELQHQQVLELGGAACVRVQDVADAGGGDALELTLELGQEARHGSDGRRSVRLAGYNRGRGRAPSASRPLIRAMPKLTKPAIVSRSCRRLNMGRATSIGARPSMPAIRSLTSIDATARAGPDRRPCRRHRSPRRRAACAGRQR